MKKDYSWEDINLYYYSVVLPIRKKKYIFSDTNLEVNQFLQGNLEASVDMPYKIMD